MLACNALSLVIHFFTPPVMHFSHLFKAEAQQFRLGYRCLYMSLMLCLRVWMHFLAPTGKLNTWQGGGAYVYRHHPDFGWFCCLVCQSPSCLFWLPVQQQQQGVAPLQQVVVQGGSSSTQGPLSPGSATAAAAGEHPSQPRPGTDSARQRQFDGFAQRGAEWAAQRSARIGMTPSKANSGSRPASMAATAGSSVLTSAPNSCSSRASSGGTVPPAAMLMQVIRARGGGGCLSIVCTRLLADSKSSSN